jgi:hypothetical protein
VAIAAKRAPRPPRPPPAACDAGPVVQKVFLPAMVIPRKRGEAVPSLDAMCAHAASLGATAQDCVETWRGYRDSEPPERWECQATCRGQATTYEELLRCDTTCRPVVNNFDCACVVREDDLAEALGFGVTLAAPSGRSSMECIARAVLDGMTASMQVALYIHNTLADAAAQLLDESSPDACRAVAAKGHVVYVVDGVTDGACDKAALQRIIDKVSARLGE